MKVDVLLPEDSPPQAIAKDTPGVEFYHFPLGFASDPPPTGQQSFCGFHMLGMMEVDLVVVGKVEEDRGGSTIMSRVRKAAGAEVVGMVSISHLPCDRGESNRCFPRWHEDSALWPVYIAIRYNVPVALRRSRRAPRTERYIVGMNLY